MSRITFLAIGLFTFFLGVMFNTLYRQSLDSFRDRPDLEALIQPPPAEYQNFVTPLRIGVFIGGEGVTYSPNRSKFTWYEGYEDEEITVMMSPAELSDVAGKLVSAGLLEESEMNTPISVSLPMSHTIVIEWPDRVREFQWISRDECKVPDRYTAVLRELNSKYDNALVRRFVQNNEREVRPFAVLPSGCFGYNF